MLACVTPDARAQTLDVERPGTNAGLLAGTRHSTLGELGRELRALGYSKPDRNAHAIALEASTRFGRLRIPVWLEFSPTVTSANDEGTELGVSRYDVGLGFGWELARYESLALVPAMVFAIGELGLEASGAAPGLFPASAELSRLDKTIGALEPSLTLETEVFATRSPGEPSFAPVWTRTGLLLMLRIGYRQQLFQSEWTRNWGGPSVDTSGAFVLFGVGFFGVYDHREHCDARCGPAPNARRICGGYACGFVCHAGFMDCDGRPDNGCEVRSRDCEGAAP